MRTLAIIVVSAAIPLVFLGSLDHGLAAAGLLALATAAVDLWLIFGRR